MVGAVSALVALRIAQLLSCELSSWLLPVLLLSKRVHMQSVLAACSLRISTDSLVLDNCVLLPDSK